MTIIIIDFNIMHKTQVVNSQSNSLKLKKVIFNFQPTFFHYFQRFKLECIKSFLSSIIEYFLNTTSRLRIELLLITIQYSVF